MLVEFSVANFRSFRDLQRVSMQAAPLRNNDTGLDEGNVITIGEKLRLLKSKAIIGGNASGKSNITQAIGVFSLMVQSSVKLDNLSSTIWGDRFGLLTDWEDQPVFFQIVFLHSETLYRYGFQILDGKVDQEWLFGHLGKQEAYLFKRGSGGLQINSNTFKEGVKFIDLALEGEGEIFRPDSLFLTAAATMGANAAVEIRRAITSILLVDGTDDANALQFAMKKLDEDARRNETGLQELMRSADLGIENITLKEMPDELFQNRVPTELREYFKESTHNPKTLFTTRSRYDAAGNKIDDIQTAFADWESEGTKKFLAIGSLVLLALGEGRTLVIDEFDARFHPLLTEKILELFHSSETNPHGAQLIFVTHDTGLLNRGNLRRDQICLVEKDRYGISTLKTLIEIKGVRKDASYEKEYLQGTYGAIGYLNRIPQVISHIVNEDEGLPETE